MYVLFYKTFQDAPDSEQIPIFLIAITPGN